ncbi:ABC transporter permease [Gemmatimonadota bacterium]
MISHLAFAVYRLTILLYPREFRIRFASEMVNDFAARSRLAAGTGGRRAAFVYWVRSISSVFPSAFRVRVNTHRSKSVVERPASSQKVGRGIPRFSGKGRINDPRPPVWNHITGDLRYCLRTLSRKPLFATAVVLTMALGIGANTATFSAVNGILLRPLIGVESPEQLVQVYRHWPAMEFGSSSIPHYQDIRDRTGEVFDNVAAWVFVPLALTVNDRAERVSGMMVSANFFQTYGVASMLGRAFLPGEESVGAGEHPVTVVSHAFWESRLGANRSVIGETITVNGHSFEVVGVAPPKFKGPVNGGDVAVYVPIMMQRQVVPAFDWIESRGTGMLRVVGRLADGVTLERADQVLEATLLQLREEFPNQYNGDLGVTVVPERQAGMHPTLRGSQLAMGTVVMAVVSILLLIACANVANLLLARARERRREMGIRLSLGAGSGRILQQLLTESLLLCLFAGLVALGVARLAVSLINRVHLPSLGPYGNLGVEIDGPVLLFTFGVSIVAGLFFGLLPALHAARANTVLATKGESSESCGRSRIGSGLVVIQMALSVLLLVGSGLFLRNLQGALSIDPGFDEPSHLVLASMDPGLQGYDKSRAREFFDRLLEETTALPAVLSAGMSTSLPLSLDYNYSYVAVPGYEFAEEESRNIGYALVTEGYLESLGATLLEGRFFTRLDDANAPPTIVVNEAFEQRFWPGERAVGKIVETMGSAREVIGVVETSKYHSLGEAPTEFLYLPHREQMIYGMTLVARSSTDPLGVLGQIREITRRLDPQLPLHDVRTMADNVGIALLPARLNVYVLGAFAVLGLLLAAVGIYGVLAYSVSRRTREIGIRVAVGADRWTIEKLILREGLGLTLLGAVLGLLGAAGASRLVQNLLYGVGALDPVAFGAVPLVLLVVATLAVWLPARRAASVEPVTALRTE